MATLVQQPDVANTQVSQLQAIDRPVKPSASLSDFIVAALPAAKAVVDTLQEGSKEHNLALGMNDELNQVTRDVSWLDRKYYEQGRDIQTIQTAMVGMDNEVAQNLYQRISDNPDLSEEEALAEYYDRNTTAINAIFESKLDTETKTKLYESQLQAHAQQIKTVKETYKQVGLEMEVKGRNSRADSFASAILTDGDVTDGQLAFGRLVTSSEAAYARRQDLNPEQRHQAIQAEVKANLKATISLLRNNTELKDSDNIRLVERLKQSVQTQLSLQGIDGVDYSTWVEADGDIKQLQDDLAKQSEDNFVLQRTLDNTDYEAGVTPYTADQFNTAITKINSALDSGQITASTATRLINQETSLYTKANAAKLGSEDAEYTGADIVNGNMSVQDFNYLIGKPLDSTEEYNKRVSHYYKETYGNTPEGRAQAAIAMIKHSDEGGGRENNPALRRLGSDLLWGGLTQYLTNPSSMNDDQFKRAEAYWALLQEQYNGYMKSQPTRVDDLLGADTLTESQRMMMGRVLRDGGSLKRAIQDFQRSDDFKGNVDAYRTSVNSWDTKKTGITSFWGNGTLMGQRQSFAGNLFADLKGRPNAASRDDIVNTTLKFTKDVFSQSDYKLAEQLGVLDGERAIQVGAKYGMVIPSQSRYNAAVVNINAANTLNSNSAIPEGVRGVYSSKAIDSMIYQYSRQNNIEASNVFVTTRDRNGMYLYFQHLTKDGVLNDEPRPVPISTVVSKATSIYRTAREDAVSPKVTRDVVGGVNPAREQYGFVTKPSKKETYTYTPNKPIGKLTLTAMDSAHRGQKFNVNVPSQTAVMFNGNTDLTMAAIQHLGIKEGLFLKVQDVVDKSSGKVSTNGALQISLTKNPKWAARIRKAEGNAQELMNIQGDFLAEYFSKLQESTARVGSPIAKADTPYPTAHRSTQFYLMDLMYHGGNSSTHMRKVESTLTRSSETAGLSELKALPAYKSSNADRRLFLERALTAHYRVRQAYGKR